MTASGAKRTFNKTRWPVSRHVSFALHLEARSGARLPIMEAAWLHTLVAAGMGLALVPTSVENINTPNIAYRPLANFAARWELVMVSRRNEPSPAVRRFIEIVRTPDTVEHQSSVAPQDPSRSHAADNFPPQSAAHHHIVAAEGQETCRQRLAAQYENKSQRERRGLSQIEMMWRWVFFQK
jgi:hypothetical protein